MTSFELLSKYDVPGPRYTSYPTVPYWATPPTADQWREHLQAAMHRTHARGEGSSLYVHVPFCRSLCHYCGCNTVITRDASGTDPYVEALLAEWALYTSVLGVIRLDEVHLGGGTPTYLTAGQLERLMNGLRVNAQLPTHAELSIEADPRVTSREQLVTLAKAGFTRLSLGIQDFDEEVQHAVNRVQTVAQVQAVTEAARELGFRSVNYDLIYGLPMQTEDSVKRTVEVVKTLRPDRIAFYGYAHVPWLKSAHRKFQDADVPGGLAKRRLYEVGRGSLEAAGYHEIGLDHFALESDGLWQAVRSGTLHRNFMGYTERRTMPVFGLGVSAIGDTWTAFAQNEKTLATWHQKIAQGEWPLMKGHVLDEEDQAIRGHILEVMTRFETDLSTSSSALTHLKEVPDRLEEMRRDGLVEVNCSRVSVTEAGKPFVRNVCMALDARLARQAPQTQIFSRTV